MDLLRQRPDVRLGHVLASYALDFTGLQGGGWREAVDEALTATRAAYSSSPPPQVVAYLDRKVGDTPPPHRQAGRQPAGRVMGLWSTDACLAVGVPVVMLLTWQAFKGADRERLLSFLRDERGVTAVLKATDIPP